MSQKVVIIGGVAGGASCAARLRRLDEKAEISLIERGPYISFANCGLPYHIGKIIPERDSLLVQTEEGFRRRFQVNVMTQTEAVALDRDRRVVRLRRLLTGEEFDLAYDQLVLSPGAAPVRPRIPGVDLPGVHVLRNIPDLDQILSEIEGGGVRHATIMGGGFIGIELAENLIHRGIPVALVEMADRIMPVLDPEMSAVLAREASQNGVEIRVGAAVQAIRQTLSGGKRLALDLQSGEEVQTDLVFLSVGVRPETELAAKAGLTLGALGGIQVDAQMRTSDPSIFAVGDAVEVKNRVTGAVGRVPLAGPANRQGRLVADVIAGRKNVYAGALGTSIVKVFNLVAASTGLTERQAVQSKVPYRVALIHGSSHASYYPGATSLILKALFEPDSGKLLGAQAVGQEGVDKRIDVLATAIAGRMTVFDLEELDLAYSPPFSSAKDPVNHLAAVAAGMLRGDHPVLRWDEIAARQASGDLVLDVRTADEFLLGAIPGALNIPLDELRTRLGELPQDRKIVVYCQIGLRGYLATRILVQHGYEAANVMGGYKLWSTVNQPVRQNSVMTPRCCGSAPTIHSAVAPSRLDVRGLACPGPILKTKQAMDSAGVGTTFEIFASDPGFATDLPAWASRLGHQVLSVKLEKGEVRALIQKGESASVALVDKKKVEEGQTEVVFSGDLDRALAALIIATGGASMGKKVTLFFTFWGLNILRKHEAVPVKKSFMGRMFGLMMPRGALRARLSKMHFFGVGTQMMRKVMESKKVDSLETMLSTAQRMGVKFVACQMSMDVMGIRREELIDGVEVGGVASYLAAADQSRVNLFI